MIKQIIRKHIKKIAGGILIILALTFVINIYGDFVQPFIDPYFFKIDNVEKIIGAKLQPPSSGILVLGEYEVITEPSYRFAGTKGIKEIYATIQIDERIYESLKEKWNFEYNYSFNLEEHIVNYMLDKRNYKSFNIEDFEEIQMKHYTVPLGEHVYHGFCSIYSSGREVGIYIVLAKINGFYCLYVFNEI